MKNKPYRYIPFAITLPSLAMIWLTSVETNPVWLKHLIFSLTFLLIFLIFLFFSLAKMPQQATAKLDSKKNHYRFIPFLVLAMTVPSIVINILRADLSDLAKVLVITITLTIGVLIFGLSALIHHRKQIQHEN